MKGLGNIAINKNIFMIFGQSRILNKTQKNTKLKGKIDELDYINIWNVCLSIVSEMTRYKLQEYICNMYNQQRFCIKMHIKCL